MHRSLILTIAAALAVVACGGGSTTAAPTSSVPAATTPAGASSAPVPSVPTGTDQAPVEFKSGEATLTLTGSEKATVELGEIVPSEDGSIFSGFDPVEGTSVSWREAGKQKGWYLSVVGFFGDGPIMTDDPSPFLSLTDPQDRNVQDMAGRCTVNVSTSTRERFEGTVDCAGLTWLDAEGEPTGDPFDAKVTFSASP